MGTRVESDRRSTRERSRDKTQSPGFASPSAMALRMAAATCSCKGTGLVGSISTFGLVLLTL